jgi:hypothetical protein
MDLSLSLQKAMSFEREGRLELAIELYAKVWRAENRPATSVSLEGMWRLGLSIFEERRNYLEKALSQTRLTPTMEEGLSYLRDIPQALSLLAEYFYEETHQEIFRANTIKAIGLLEDPRRIPFLSDLLQHPNMHFRRRAIYALDLEPSSLVLRHLQRALANDSLEVRFMAIHSLIHRKEPQSLFIALQQSRTLEEQYRLVIGLTQLEFKPVAPFLLKLLQIPDQELLCLVAEALK